MAEPGAGSFKNLEPLSREERLAARNKDALEKNRIAARQGGQNGGGVRLPPVQNPISPVKNSALYIEEYDRFNRDVAGELHRKKLEAIQKREEAYERKRAEGYYREKSKWDYQEQLQNRTESKYQQLRDQGLGGKRNQSSTAYNIISLNYDKTPNGQALAAKDEVIKQKAQMRAVSIYTRNHSVTHDIINHRPLYAENFKPPVYQTVAPWDK